MKRRQGFTLVELLVSMALILFIMAILSGAFVAATGTFRSLKASGDMAERLRATTGLLQHDLAADHFDGKKRLSNPNFWLNGPPSQGFFQIYQAGTGTQEGGVTDLDGIPSYRSTGHALAFTIKVRGNQMGDFLSASAPARVVNATFGPAEARYQGTAYNYQWGEVAWFMRPQVNPANNFQQDTTVVDPVNGSQPVGLFTLYRRQRLAVPDNSLVNPPMSYTTVQQFNAAYARCLELSCWPRQFTGPGSLYFNNPIDLTVPGRRLGQGIPLNFQPLAMRLQGLGATNPTLAGADIQLTDVISFDVRVLPLGASGSPDPFVTLFQPPFTTAYKYTAPLWASDGKRVFDTWSSVYDAQSNYSQWNVLTPPKPGTTIPFWNGTSGPIILAIQVSIRIWDSKTNQTRQVTLVQAM